MLRPIIEVLTGSCRGVGGVVDRSDMQICYIVFEGSYRDL